MSGQKNTPLIKEEVLKLVELVTVNPVVMSKATNASNNQLKEAAWLKITDFNALIGSCPRKPEQLRLKWENLKKSARKRHTKIRMNNLKTGGGKPDYIPPDDTLDKVASLLGPTCDGYSVSFGGDAEGNTEGEVVDELMVEPVVVKLPFDDQDPLASPPVTPQRNTPNTSTQKLFFSSSRSKGKLTRQAVADSVKKSIIERNKAIAEYYSSKTKIAQELHALKKRKMELDLSEREKKQCPSNDQFV